MSIKKTKSKTHVGDLKWCNRNGNVEQAQNDGEKAISTISDNLHVRKLLWACFIHVDANSKLLLTLQSTQVFCCPCTMANGP